MKRMQADTSFQGKKGEVEVILTLTEQDSSQNLSIQLIYTEQCVKYAMCINYEYISAQDSHFTANIQSVGDLYEHLVSDFDKTVITSDGAIIFEVEVMIRKKVERRPYRLQGEKYKVSAIEQMRLQMEKMFKILREDSEKKDHRISELEQRLNKNEEESKKLISDLQQEISNSRCRCSSNCQNQKNQKNPLEQERYNNIDELKKMILVEIKEIQKEEEEKKKLEQSKLKSQQKLNNKQIKLIDSENSCSNLPLTKQEEKNVSQKQFIEKTDIEKKLAQQIMHPENPHKNSFNVKQQNGRLIITRVGSNAKWHSYFGAEQLQAGKVHCFEIKQVKSRGRKIMTGIGSRNAFGIENAYEHKQTMSFYSNCASTNSEGQFSESGKAVMDGSILMMIVDLIEFTIEWQFDDNGKRQVTENIRPEMKNIPLFLLIQLSFIDSIVQLRL